MRALGREARDEGTCYLVGGATAVLIGWRESTVDVDIELEPQQDSVLRAVARLKNEHQINIELASPAQFVPLPSGWRDRSPIAAREGRLTFRHYDLYSQALAKLERGHERDRADVGAMLERDLVDAGRLFEAYEEIEPELYRFPAVDPAGFRQRVVAATGRG
jgi:hypothetical protein